MEITFYIDGELLTAHFPTEETLKSFMESVRESGAYIHEANLIHPEHGTIQ